MSRTIILASQSPQRKNIIQAAGIDFQVIPANIDEKAVLASDPYQRASKIAQQKARAVQEKYPNSIVVAADTFILLQDEVLEKPTDLKEAKEMLIKQSGQVLTELTGFCYLDSVEKIEFVKTVAVEVKMRKLAEAEIDRYIATQPVLTWSAAFCPAYDSGASLIESINGSFTGFTHGLPVEELIPLLQQSKIL